MKEIWKGIKGYEESYLVSNYGNVCSLNYRNTGKKKNLVPKVNNCGRLWVEIGGKPFLIHRLVAACFLPNDSCLPEINHKDGNPQNNCVDNLEWCTGEYNRQHYFKNNECGREKKNTRKVLQMDISGKIVRQWDDSRTVSNETGMNQWSITQCCDGKRKTAYGFKWQYAV